MPESKSGALPLGYTPIDSIFASVLLGLEYYTIFFSVCQDVHSFFWQDFESFFHKSFHFPVNRVYRIDISLPRAPITPKACISSIPQEIAYHQHVVL